MQNDYDIAVDLARALDEHLKIRIHKQAAPVEVFRVLGFHRPREDDNGVRLCNVAPEFPYPRPKHNGGEFTLSIRLYIFDFAVGKALFQFFERTINMAFRLINLCAALSLNERRNGIFADNAYLFILFFCQRKDVVFVFEKYRARRRNLSCNVVQG